MVRKNKKNEVYKKKENLSVATLFEVWEGAEYAYAKDPNNREKLEKVRLARMALEAKETEERSK